MHESILLLGLHDEKGNFGGMESFVHYGFTSGALMDLILEERITVEDGRVKMKTNALTGNKLLNEVLRLIRESKKERKVSHWFHYLVQRVGKLRPLAIDDLIRRNILERREDKVLWVFKVNRYPSVDLQPENELRARLHEIIYEDAEPTPKERMLLSMMIGCHMQKELAKEKADRKWVKQKMKDLTDDESLRKWLGSAVDEMQAVMMITTGMF